MKLYDKVIYCAFIYLIYRNKWILVESSDTSSTPPTAASTDTSTKTGVELSIKKTSGTNEFDYKKEGNAVTYTAKSGYGFSSVKTKSGGCSNCCGSDLTIWDAKDASEYASKVVLEGKGDKNNKVVTIHLANGSKKVFTRGGNDKPWTTVSPPAKDTSKTTGTTLASSATPTAGGGGASADGSGGGGTGTGGSGTGTGTSGGSQAGGTTSPDKSCSGTDTSAKSGSTANKNGVDLNIYAQNSTDKFQCNKNGQRRTFTPKGNNAFQLVKENNDIWKANDAKEFTSKVEVDLMNGQPKAVTIYLPDNKTKVFLKESNAAWTEIDTSKVNAKSINIKYEHSSYIYENELKNNVRTFTAKTGFAFKLVYEFIDQNNRPEIWKTDKADEYSKKVESEGGNKVTIHTANGTTKVFTKGTDGKWTEDTQASTQQSVTNSSGGGDSNESKPAT